jgi:hypothetical protein
MMNQPPQKPGQAKVVLALEQAMTTPRPQMLSQDPAVRLYVFLCLAALVAFLIVLLQSGYGRWSLLPAVVGALSVAFRWRAGALYFLLAVMGFVGLHVYEGWIRPHRQPTMADWALSASCLGFLIAYYRLLALVNGIFPVDPRRRRLGETPASLRRPTHLVTQRETGWFLVALPVWAALAQVLWRMVRARPVLDLSPTVGHIVLLGWLVGAGLLVASAILAYVGHSQLTREEATLFLQDTLWRETRREQRREVQWRVWARLRLRRKERA